MKDKYHDFEYDHKFDWFQGSNFTADENFLKWKCPLCGYQHPEIQYDLYNYFKEDNDLATLIISCQECDQVKVRFIGKVIHLGSKIYLKSLDIYLKICYKEKNYGRKTIYSQRN